MKAALAALATTGEVAAALRDVWGSYQPTMPFDVTFAMVEGSACLIDGWASAIVTFT